MVSVDNNLIKTSRIIHVIKFSNFKESNVIDTMIKMFKISILGGE